jgi:3-methylcrotonyl-CoA carboxylase beta subunit
MLVAKKAIKYLIADYVLKSQNACYNAFPVIQSHYDNNSHQAKTNYEHNLSIYKSTLELREELMNSVPKKGSNKLTVNERISLLKDNGSPILYLSTNAGLNMPYGTVKNGGAITAVTKIMNRYCMISANEWTFKGGTSYPITVKKQLRAQEIAFDNRLPCIYVVDSGGAFLPLQV